MIINDWLNMDNYNEKFNREVSGILLDQFGKIFAESYQKYYADKDPVFILRSLQELLNELLGEKISLNMINKIKTNYKELFLSYEK